MQRSIIIPLIILIILLFIPITVSSGGGSFLQRPPPIDFDPWNPSVNPPAPVIKTKKAKGTYLVKRRECLKLRATALEFRAKADKKDGLSERYRAVEYDHIRLFNECVDDLKKNRIVFTLRPSISQQRSPLFDPLTPMAINDADITPIIIPVPEGTIYIPTGEKKKKEELPLPPEHEKTPGELEQPGVQEQQAEQK